MQAVDAIIVLCSCPSKWCTNETVSTSFMRDPCSGSSFQCLRFHALPGSFCALALAEVDPLRYLSENSRKAQHVSLAGSDGCRRPRCARRLDIETETQVDAAADHVHLANVADEAELVFDGEDQVQRLLFPEVVRQRELAMVRLMRRALRVRLRVLAQRSGPHFEQLAFVLIMLRNSSAYFRNSSDSSITTGGVT